MIEAGMIDGHVGGESSHRDRNLANHSSLPYEYADNEWVPRAAAEILA